jgi:hypothetical protein
MIFPPSPESASLPTESIRELLADFP